MSAWWRPHTRPSHEGSGAIVTSKWQTDRGQLNHNWLQNGVLVALNHALGLVSGRVRSGNIVRTLTEDVHRWRERGAEIPPLLHRFEEEMSPRVYFTRPPLSRCRDETKQWLIPLIHHLWMCREQVTTQVGEAVAAHQVAELSYENVHEALQSLPALPSSEDLHRLEPLLREFTVACEALSRTISALPHEIRVA